MTLAKLWEIVENASKICHQRKDDAPISISHKWPTVFCCNGHFVITSEDSRRYPVCTSSEGLLWEVNNGGIDVSDDCFVYFVIVPEQLVNFIWNFRECSGGQPHLAYQQVFRVSKPLFMYKTPSTDCLPPANARRSWKVQMNDNCITAASVSEHQKDLDIEVQLLTYVIMPRGMHCLRIRSLVWCYHATRPHRQTSAIPRLYQLRQRWLHLTSTTKMTTTPHCHNAQRRGEAIEFSTLTT